MLKKVISGGQVGVDQAALAAAMNNGFETGGWAPKGWKTRHGPMAAVLSKMYGLKEHSGGYKERTWQNVKDSDATIRFAENFLSAGEVCTLNAIRRFNKPYLDIPVRKGILEVKPKKVIAWLEMNHIEILNVAGNAIEDVGIAAYVFLCDVLVRLKRQESFSRKLTHEDND